MSKRIIVPATDTSEKQESSTVTYEGRIPESTFGEAIRAIDSGFAQGRRGIVVAFRAAVADVMCSKSTKRLDVFWKHVSGTPLAGKIRTALYVFTGGFTYAATPKGTDRIYTEDKSVLEYSAKTGWLLKSNISREDWAVAVAAFTPIAGFDWDCITVKRPKAPVTLDPVVKALKTVKEKRHELPSEQRQKFIRLWDMACEVFPELAGMGLTVEPPATDKPVGQDGKTAADMPAKPNRTRGNKNAA